MESQIKIPRILLAGVPFGCDNIGDEAILACIIEMVREVLPSSQITVSTRDHKHTPKKLSVKTCPLYGFDSLKPGEPTLEETLSSQDFVIWPGATGLSDYPEIPLEIMEKAQSLEIPTMLFCTGMNTELNPYLYQLQPGKRKAAYSLIQRLSLGSIDLSAKHQEQKETATRQRISSVLPAMKARIVRDPESLAILAECLKSQNAPIELGADPALITTPTPFDEIKLSETCQSWIKDSKFKKFGLCISAQSPVAQLAELASTFDRIMESENAVVIGLPMNPITDAKLLEEFKPLLKYPEKLEIAYNCSEPEEITAIAAKMDIVISSRLHLLILSTIHRIPIIGISRGSKVTNFTHPLGVKDVGSVQALDLLNLENEIRRLLNDKDGYKRTANKVMSGLETRLNHARSILKETLTSVFGS